MELKGIEKLYLKELIKINLEEVGIKVGGFADGKVKILDNRFFVLGYVEYSKYFDSKRFYNVELFIESFSYVLRDVLSLTKNVEEVIINSPSYFGSYTPQPSSDFFCGNNLFFEQNPLEKIFVGGKCTDKHIEMLKEDDFGEILALGEKFPSVSVCYEKDRFVVYPSCVEFKTYKKLYYPLYSSIAEMVKEKESIDSFGGSFKFYTWAHIDYYYTHKVEKQKADLEKIREELLNIASLVDVEKTSA